MPFDALLFDLDGTILDSEIWHQAAEIEAFSKLGITITHEDLAPIMGRPLPAMLEHLGERFRPVSVDEFLEVEMPILGAMIRDQMEAFPDAQRLIDRWNGPLALCTSSPAWYVKAVCERFPFLDAHFSTRVIGADVVCGKPDPEPYLMTCGKLGVAPERCLAIEDSPNGVASARAAGCFVVGIDREEHGRLTNAHLRVRSLDHVLS